MKKPPSRRLAQKSLGNKKPAGRAMRVSVFNRLRGGAFPKASESYGKSAPRSVSQSSATTSEAQNQKGPQVAGLPILELASQPLARVPMGTLVLLARP